MTKTKADPKCAKCKHPKSDHKFKTVGCLAECGSGYICKCQRFHRTQEGK